MLDIPLNLDSYIKRALSNLDERQAMILVKRFGLDSDEPLTLAEVGNSHGITRERVRQIANNALNSVQGRVESLEATQAFADIVSRYLSRVGGVRQHDILINDLGTLLKADASSPVFENKVTFLFAILEQPILFKENDHYHQFWYLDKPSHERAVKFVDSILASAKKRKNEVLSRGGFYSILTELVKRHEITEAEALNYLKISKKFAMNPYGDFGLAHWIEIAPKTVRDKAYIVLKKVAEPMHFADVAARINELHSSDGKQADHRTVHNELIKDNRFVLVGRGMYGLGEHGFLPGTAREVIIRILKDSSPLDINSIVRLVTEQRPFKRNTILLNLQNKSLFKKMPDGRYTLV